MKVVISCAKKKADRAGYMRTKDERCVKFVGDPDLAKAASQKTEFCYARPDDEAKDGKTWREELVAYNKSCKDENPFGLLRAYKLYSHKRYAELVEVFGIDNVYILSAGWGLIRASFLTPNYDITFRGSGYNRRGKFDQYCDFNHLQEDSHLMNNSNDKVVFFGTDSESSDKNGGIDGYLPLFCDLTKAYPGHRIAYYYHSKDKPKYNKNVEFVPYETRTRTLWHYECAKKVIECYKSDPCGFDPRKIKG